MQLEFLKTAKPNRILQILSKPRGIQFCKLQEIWLRSYQVPYRVTTSNWKGYTKRTGLTRYSLFQDCDKFGNVIIR